MRVKIWNEFLHEQGNDVVRAIYPNGIHAALAEAIGAGIPDAIVSTATLADPEHGLTQAALDETDVLVWWGHLAHHKVDDAVVERVVARVQQGMGLLVLHSAHLSKPFTRLMGTTCNLRWREADDQEIVWSVSPSHPICRDLEGPIVLAEHEMYGEFFDIPPPDELIFISSFSGGEVFRSGCCFYRGKGRIFYFSPGHETYPIYHQPEIRRVIVNAVNWAYQESASSVVTDSSPNAPKGWFRAE